MRQIYVFGPLRLDTHTASLTCNGQPTGLGPRAVRLLHALLARQNEYVSKSDLLEAAWPGLIVEEANLSVQMSSIRKVLEQAGTAARIETLARRGYRFVGTVATESPHAANNLPRPLTSFVGREKEIADVTSMLASARLLTLTGAGGAGKTRLALEVANGLLASHADGVWVVELAALADPDRVPQRVAMALGLKEQPGRTLTQTLIDHLASRRVALVLDNAEHLLTACAQLAHDILRACGDVVLLATSREPLGVDGERLYRVPSMTMPDARRDITPDDLAPYESVRLFVDRARLQVAGFAVSVENAPAIASVCRRLDGIPLALELAAARVRSMSVQEIDGRLDQRFSLLTNNSRVALPRQKTLRSLIDWSVDLLNDAEKAMLRRVSVFAGGWTLESAGNVCVGTPIDDQHLVFDMLTALVDKSLILTEIREGSTRYRLLETVRQYARESLDRVDDAAHWRGKHLAYFTALAEEADPHLSDDDQQLWLDRLETEHDNLRAALAWSCTPGGDSTLGVRLAGAVWWFWLVRGYRGEGSDWLRAVIEASSRDHEPSVARGKAFNGAAVLHKELGDYAATRAFHEQSLEVFRALDNQRGVAVSLSGLGSLAREQGDYAKARALYEQCLAIDRDLGRRWNQAVDLGNLGLVVYDQGDHAHATELYEQGLAIFRELGDRRSIAMSLNNLGTAAHGRHDNPAAKSLHDESLAIFRDLGDQWGVAATLNNLGKVASARHDHAGAFALLKESLAIRQEIGERFGVAETLDGLAYVALHRSGPDRAIRVWAAVERLRREMGAPRQPGDRVLYDEHIAAAKIAAGGDAAFDAIWREGSTMPLSQAIVCALTEDPRG